MIETIEYQRGRSAVTSLHAHLVFVTKYRRKVLSERALRILRYDFESVCRALGVALIEAHGEEDHVHRLVQYLPTLHLGQLVGRLKGSSSRCLRKGRFSEVVAKFWGDNLWSPSYFAASCGGAPIAVVRQIY
jgi:putative transposase